MKCSFRNLLSPIDIINTSLAVANLWKTSSTRAKARCSPARCGFAQVPGEGSGAGEGVRRGALGSALPRRPPAFG